MDQTTPHFESDLPEVGDIPLEKLMLSDHSVLANALRRLKQEVDQPDAILAGFNSSI